MRYYTHFFSLKSTLNTRQIRANAKPQTLSRVNITATGTKIVAISESGNPSWGVWSEITSNYSYYISCIH